MKHTKEEIERYREAVIEAFGEYGKQYPEIDVTTEVEAMRQCPDANIEEYMECNTPKECAWMFLM